MDCKPSGSTPFYGNLQARSTGAGFAIPSPGDLSDPGMEPGSPMLWADYLPSEPPGLLLLREAPALGHVGY